MGKKSKPIKRLQPLNELKLKENYLMLLKLKYINIKWPATNLENILTIY